ncbi:MAG: hypothetical protein ABWY01_01000, partial [Pseudoxanthomonas sp.]
MAKGLTLMVMKPQFWGFIATLIALGKPLPAAQNPGHRSCACWTFSGRRGLLGPWAFAQGLSD